MFRKSSNEIEFTFACSTDRVYALQAGKPAFYDNVRGEYGSQANVSWSFRRRDPVQQIFRGLAVACNHATVPWPTVFLVCFAWV